MRLDLELRKKLHQLGPGAQFSISRNAGVYVVTRIDCTTDFKMRYYHVTLSRGSCLSEPLRGDFYTVCSAVEGDTLKERA